MISLHNVEYLLTQIPIDTIKAQDLVVSTMKCNLVQAHTKQRTHHPSFVYFNEYVGCRLFIYTMK